MRLNVTLEIGKVGVGLAAPIARAGVDFHLKMGCAGVCFEREFLNEMSVKLLRKV